MNFVSTIFYYLQDFDRDTATAAQLSKNLAGGYMLFGGGLTVKLNDSACF
jgi:hypothetical protein